MIIMLDVFKFDPEKPLVYIDMTGTHAAIAKIEDELLKSASVKFKIALRHTRHGQIKTLVIKRRRH